MDQPLLARMAMGLRTIAPDRQFYSDVSTRLMEALRGGLRDVFPDGAGPIVGRHFGVPIDPNYRDKMTNLGLAGLTVYHGSPHTFDKFDMSKIGTGEGVQAYGRGLYFAESPDVGREYAKNLANRNMANQGRLNAHANAQRLANLAGDAKYAADDVRFALESNPSHPQEQLLRDTLQHLESGTYAKPLENKGNLYKVDLPDDQIAKMLDWDKKLKDQPDILKAVLESPKYKNRRGFDPYPEMTGKDLYEMGHDQVKSLGIPGIRYLDQGSRAGGKGTSNFVVFDDTLPKIIGRE